MVPGIIPSILMVATAATTLRKPASYSGGSSRYRLDGSSINIEKVSDRQDRNDILINNATIRNLNKLDEIGMLENGWNGENATAFEKALLDKARNLVVAFIVQPEIFPLPDGKLQLEYELDNGQYLELHVGLNEQCEVFVIDAQGTPHSAIINSNATDINKLVMKFYGREL